MNSLKSLGVATFVAASLATGAHAADVVDIAAAGSSAEYYNFTNAFNVQGYTNHYSLANSTNFQIVDSSTPNNENAQVAIYWQGSTGNYRIAVYYSVDSAVGVRAYFNNDTLSTPASIALSADPTKNNKGFPGSGDVAPPPEVLAAVNGITVNVAGTTFTPEDARVATQRTIALGYSTTNPVKSAVNASSISSPIPFSLTSRPFTLKSIGAVPILVFINKNSGSDFASLSGANLNINSFQLAGFLSGQFDRTSDLDLAAGAPQNPVHTYIREPLAGVYNTTEYTNAEALAELSFTGGKQSGSILASGGQELNVASNPLNEPVNSSGNGVANAGRIRAIGSGELVGAVAGDATDALGYDAWSVGGFKNKALRYLTVDGADPIQDSYSGGAVTGATVTFRNIQNGGYPLWTIVRVVEPTNPTVAITNILTSLVGIQGGSDYVNAQALRVFRSYHATPYTPGGPNAASNGNNGLAANGGDVGGAVFSINNDQDYGTDFGSDLLNFRQ